jgi:glutaminase
MLRYFDDAGSGRVPRDAFMGALASAGLRPDDPRLASTVAALEALADGGALDRNQFGDLLRSDSLLVDRVLRGDLVIPEFAEFSAQIREIFEAARANRTGEVATYIPQLGRVDPEHYGAALCTIDGQRASFGDATTEFCVQSCCKPVNYALALEEHGEHKVHQHVGREPSGHSFNELSLNRDRRPHNPLINSGAIMSCSLIRPDLSIADRFDHVLEMWQRLSGGSKPGFSNPTYLSERQSADRNFALGYFMREHGCFPPGTDLVETLEFYFQCCSLEANCEQLSVVAATFANGGVCPVTNRRVMRADTVQKCLSLMYSCGMYDFSGEWAFSIGLPAKSGVAGALLVVVPNVMGLCTWSPRLDRYGNSVRGVELCRRLVDTFNFHNYDNLVGGHNKRDPRRGRAQSKAEQVVAVCWAASEGDLAALRALGARGVDLRDADYDGRTALHLGASEGHLHVVEFLISHGVQVSPRDRWGGTPLDDALRGGHQDVAAALRARGAVEGSAANPVAG